MSIPAEDEILTRQNCLELSDADFNFFAKLIYAQTRIVLRSEKRQMLTGRLIRRMRARKVDSIRKYRQLLENEESDTEHIELLNAVTTNLTAFFREGHHFEHLAKVALPALLAKKTAAKTNRLRIWSAGCSSGQEAYSLAMTMLNALPRPQSWDAKILATDIDTNMVAIAGKGIYDAAQLGGIPTTYQKHVEVMPETITMNAALKEKIAFKPLNLIDTWPMRGLFDIVFCRNVVIYFDKPTQSELFDRIANIMAPDGWLYIGHSESLFKVSDRFKLIATTTYQRVK